MSKARDDVLQFLDTLELTDQPPQQQQQQEAVGGDRAAQTVNSPPSASPAPASNSGRDSAAAVGGDSGEQPRRERADPKEVLNFLDKITENARKSTSSGRDAAAGALQQAETSPQKSSGSDSSSAWSWGNIWGQATALVEQNTAFTKIKSSIDTLSSEEGRKRLESQVRGFVADKDKAQFINKLGGDIKKSLGTVMEHLAPPIPEHTLFEIYVVSNLDATDGVRPWVNRTLGSVADYFEAGEVKVVDCLGDVTGIADPSMLCKRDNTFSLPKGFNEAFKASLEVVKLVAAQHPPLPARPPADQASGDDGVLYYRPHRIPIYLVLQPFQVVPTPEKAFISTCVTLIEPASKATLHTFTQMLPMDVWAVAEDALAASTDVSAADLKNMNEECLIESAMLGVKSLFVEYLGSSGQFSKQRAESQQLPLEAEKKAEGGDNDGDWSNQESSGAAVKKQG